VIEASGIRYRVAWFDRNAAVWSRQKSRTAPGSWQWAVLQVSRAGQAAAGIGGHIALPCPGGITVESLAVVLTIDLIHGHAAHHSRPLFPLGAIAPLDSSKRIGADYPPH